MKHDVEGHILEPLLTALSKEKPKTDWSNAILLIDSADEVVELIERMNADRMGGTAPAGHHKSSDLSARW